MNNIYNLSGTIINGLNGGRYKLSTIAGSGAQGVVYEEETKKYMVKLYFPFENKEMDNSTVDRLRFIKDIKIPRNFVKLVEIIENPFVGYVMEKVEDFSPLNDMLIPPAPGSRKFDEWYNDNEGLRGRYFLGYVIAKAFSELSEENLTYCDISGNNILFKVKNGVAVKMIDIDNIYIPGMLSSSVIGTPRYIAPEILRKEKNPDVFSDNYSLAVILFELLKVGHPYISDKVADGTPEEENEALEGNADYVTDESATYMLPSSYVFTTKISKLFKKCFVDGKKNRINRPSAREFEYAFLEASNSVIKCPKCKRWHLPRHNGHSFEPCPWFAENEEPHESKPKARLNFYDYLYEGKISENNIPIKVIPLNSFMIQDKKNLIKSYYVLRNDNQYNAYDKEKDCFKQTENRLENNYFSIVQGVSGYEIFNEFSKTGIYVRERTSAKITELSLKGHIHLHNGDEIIFYKINDTETTITIEDKIYAFSRAARFLLEDKE